MQFKRSWSGWLYWESDDLHVNDFLILFIARAVGVNYSDNIDIWYQTALQGITFYTLTNSLRKCLLYNILAKCFHSIVVITSASQFPCQHWVLCLINYSIISWKEQYAVIKIMFFENYLMTWGKNSQTNVNWAKVG